MDYLVVFVGGLFVGYGVSTIMEYLARSTNPHREE
jgi:hypothetical protein